jgi:hypothetical protein
MTNLTPQVVEDTTMFSRLFGSSSYVTWFARLLACTLNSVLIIFECRSPAGPEAAASITKRRIHVLVTSLVSGGSPVRVVPAVAAVSKLVDKEKYIVGSLDAARLATDPWGSQTSLLVLVPVCAELPRVSTANTEVLGNYLMTAGRILFLSDGTAPVTKEQLSETPLAGLCSHDSTAVLTIEDFESPCSLVALKDALKAAGIAVMEDAGEGGGEFSRDMATLACDDPTVIEELWSHWAMSPDSQLVMLPSKLSMAKLGTPVTEVSLSESGSVLHLTVAPSASLSGSAVFRWDTYFTQLKTSTIGRTVMHFNVVGSTQTVLDKHAMFLKSLPASGGLAIIANQCVPCGNELVAVLWNHYLAPIF